MNQLGTTPIEAVRTYLRLVNDQLSVSPNTGQDWRTIARRLRAAADQARIIAAAAERMEATHAVTESEANA